MKRVLLINSPNKELFDEELNNTLAEHTGNVDNVIRSEGPTHYSAFIILEKD